MAAAQHSESETMGSPTPSETCVELRLEFVGCSHEELEQWAAVIQEVVDERAAEAAPGAVVGGTFDPLSVEILFTVENATPAEVHQRVTAVVEAIQAVVPSAFDTDTATRSGERREPIPA
jgi:hypothetical protein